MRATDLFQKLTCKIIRFDTWQSQPRQDNIQISISKCIGRLNAIIHQLRITVNE